MKGVVAFCLVIEVTLWPLTCLVSSRCAAAGNHVLLRLHVGPGQLLCVHDFLPCVCLPGAGGKGAVLRWEVTKYLYSSTELKYHFEVYLYFT